MLLVALAAVNRPGPIGLEGNLGLLAALRAGYICHFSWTAIVAAAPVAAAAAAVIVSSLEHFISRTLGSIQRIELATNPISTNLFESTKM